MVEKVDVLVENFAPGTIGRLGLSYEEVKAINPQIVMCSVSAFGQTGPLANQPGYDYIAQAYAGITHMIGDPLGAPSFPMVGLGDVGTGVHAMGAIACTLLYRETKDKGQYIDISLLDSYFHCHEMSVQISSGSKGTINPIRSGSQHYAICPIGLFKGKDAYLFVIALDHQWGPLCRVMGRPELAGDPRFSSNANRVAHIDQVTTVIEEWLASTESDEEAIRVLQEARLPVAPVLTTEQTVNHSHLRERRTVRTIVDREFGELEISGMPLKFSEFPEELPLETPSLGQHNEHVLMEYLSYTSAEVRVLEDEAVLRRAK